MSITQFMPNGTIHLYRDDLPEGLALGPVVAVDTETMGLNPHRDRLCLVQLSGGDGHAHLVQLIPPQRGGRGFDCPNLKRLLADPAVVKLMHFAPLRRGGAAAFPRYHRRPVKCTKIAAKLVRTFTDRHGLKDLCKDLLGVDLSKQQQSSDWGAMELTSEQLAYAASDVLYLHALWAKLEALLIREDRLDLAEACFAFLPAGAGSICWATRSRTCSPIEAGSALILPPEEPNGHRGAEHDHEPAQHRRRQMAGKPGAEVAAGYGRTIIVAISCQRTAPAAAKQITAAPLAALTSAVRVGAMAFNSDKSISVHTAIIINPIAPPK